MGLLSGTGGKNLKINRGIAMATVSQIRTCLYVVQSLISICVVLLIAGVEVAGAEAPGPDEKIEVRSYLDRESAGWAYKKSDYAFVVETKGCRIQWNAVEMKEQEGEKRHLGVRRDCPIAFSEQVSLHRAILKEIFSQWPVGEFDTISWGNFGDPADWSWNIPIAIASYRSKEYRDYRVNYPKTRFWNLNGIFVKLANETKSYRDLQLLIQEFGADIELLSVEKVLTSPAKEIPFYPDLRDHNISAKTRLIYDAGFTYFRIKKR
jgi:hypothetical protein